jgi:hypothetical protein
MEISSNEIKSNIDKLELYSENYPFNLPLRISNFENETEYNKFVKNCEKLVRGSLEYKLWHNYITDVLGINVCALTNEINSEVGIEIHHQIPSLFILVKALVNKRLENHETFSTFDISLETIELHFQNRVGYIPLISAMHEKLHAGFLKIPIELVKGDYNYFLNEYSKYLDSEDLDSLQERMAISLKDYKYEGWTKDNYPGLKINATN